MKSMNSEEIRQAFLEFFESKQHQKVDSASLVPTNDPTLLFTNAGMVQFKEALALRENRGYTRATSCQRCVRAGGKHNDLDNVGYTARHHTFFEMLGNFSFGDYFKQEAIAQAWEFLTGVLQIPAEKLWVTVHDSDDEAERIWVEEIGFDKSRVSRLGDKDNFWAMGDTGPCGPCSEIFYDHGADVPGGPPGSPDDDLDRYVEIWNLVFPQYDRSEDGTLTPLEKPGVDTGMGLERLAAVLQGVHNNYDTDIFQSLILKAGALLNIRDQSNESLRVIADHIRSCAFLIADGVLPSNEGRGYVLRRIIRRALRHGHKLQSQSPFFHKMVSSLDEQMGEAYPVLRETRERIEKILLKEEEQFDQTLDQGMRLLSEHISDLEGTEIPGEVVFKLYDTYGFPPDLTADIARERELTLDMEGFEVEMTKQRERARAASRFEANVSAMNITASTMFNGYEALNGKGRVMSLIVGEASVNEINEGDEAIVILDATPFYAESGGQVGDMGRLFGNGQTFEVLDTIKGGEAHLHKGLLQEGTLKVGDELEAQVHGDQRAAIRLNHSATHLLHAALREILGPHVNQRGSLVTGDRLRFDFSHFEPVTPEQQRQIARRVNEEIRENSVIQTELMSLADARSSGAMALFNEKYADEVRVLTMGDGYSVELCGGTHASRTGDIGYFRLLSEEGTASGVRRILASTGQGAIQAAEDLDVAMGDASALLRADADGLTDKLKQLLDQHRQLEKEVGRLNTRLASSAGQPAGDTVAEVAGVKVSIQQLEDVDPKSLRQVCDNLKDKLGSGVVCLATVTGAKISLVAGVTKDLTDRVKAGDLVNHIAAQVGGKGGGRPDFAQAGGSDVDALPGALESVQDYLQDRLGGV